MRVSDIRNRMCWLGVFVLLIAMVSGCNLNQPQTVDITSAPSPTILFLTATYVPASMTPSPSPTATLTQTPQSSNTPIPPSSTIGVESTLTPTIALTATPPSDVWVRPPNQRASAYDAPGTDSNLVRLVQGKQQIRAVGRVEDNTWLQIEFADGVRGWVTNSSVMTSVDIASLPVTATIVLQEYIATVQQSADGLRLRESPEATDNVMLYLQGGEPLIIDGRLADNIWLKVRRTNGTAGWVMRSFVDIPFDIETIPIVQKTVFIPEPTLAPTLTQRPVQQQPTSAPAGIIINEGQVNEAGNGLRLRELPALDSRVFFNLASYTPVTVEAQTADSIWVLVETPAQGKGWVATQYLDLFFELSAIPVIEYPSPVYNPLAPDEPQNPVVSQPQQPTNTTANPGQYVFQSGIRGAGNIYNYGQSLGNNPYLFTKVGDSLTATAGFLYQIGWRNYNLGDYAYLQSVIDHFGSSYEHTAKSMLSGWKSYSVLDPELADPSACQEGETPLQCEYRITRPAFALVLLGTNDVYEVSPSQYETFMRDIIEISIDNGVVPIVSTVPLRLDFQSQVQAFNDVLRRLVVEYDVPLWDLYNEVMNLPNHGLSSDQVHLSAPGEDLGNTANFTGGNLQYGMNARNLSALRMLESMLRAYVWG